MRYQVTAVGESANNISIPREDAKKRRVEALDLARGFAVALMILSHGIKGLLGFDQIPAWGLVPIHLITKFSSSLFILVFGASLAVAFLPHVGTPSWPEKRKRLLIRGLKVFFWYKVLTIVEMNHLYSPDDIVKTLLYQAFPVYVEILGFYAIALIWVPFFLSVWKPLPTAVKWMLPIATTWLAHSLYQFDFGGHDTIKAILVEHESHYTWGQLARAPLIFFGLLLGEQIRKSYWLPKKRFTLAGAIGGLAVLLLGGFFIIAQPGIQETLVSIAKNEGKHPPELDFMLFSMGGALALIALSLSGGRILASILRPITTIGQDSLQSFIFHIFVIFVFYRYLFGYWKSVPYDYALFLTTLLIMMTAGWIKLSSWVQRRS